MNWPRQPRLRRNQPPATATLLERPLVRLRPEDGNGHAATTRIGRRWLRPLPDRFVNGRAALVAFSGASVLFALALVLL